MKQSDKCNEERFLRDCANHKMEILRDSGVDRHIRFRQHDTYCYFFDLITWRHHLCITGDCGTYVFNRVPDMFEFFHDKKYDYSKHLYINPYYWHQKCIASSTGYGDKNGIKEFSPELFKKAIKQEYKYFIQSNELTKEERKELIESIYHEVYVYADENPFYTLSKVNDFEHEKFNLKNFFEYNLEEYTFHYLWNLYAIVWGIHQYKQFTSDQFYRISG